MPDVSDQDVHSHSQEALPGGAASVPDTQRLRVDLGAVSRGRRRVYMDVAAVFFSADGRTLGAVDRKCSELFGISRAENDPGRGDRRWSCHEALVIDLLEVPLMVEHVFVLLAFGADPCYVQSVSVRVTGTASEEVARGDAETDASGQGSALMVAEMCRDQGGHWIVKVLDRVITATFKTRRDVEAEARCLIIDRRAESDAFRPQSSLQELRERTWSWVASSHPAALLRKASTLSSLQTSTLSASEIEGAPLDPTSEEPEARSWWDALPSELALVEMREDEVPAPTTRRRHCGGCGAAEEAPSCRLGWFAVF